VRIGGRLIGTYTNVDDFGNAWVFGEVGFQSVFILETCIL